MSKVLPAAFTPIAAQQIDDAARWWRENRSTARVRFHEELAFTLALIGRFPNIGKPARNPTLPGVRQVRRDRIQHVIYYRRVEEPSPHIEVLAVRHFSRGDSPSF